MKPTIFVLMLTLVGCESVNDFNSFKFVDAQTDAHAMDMALPVVVDMTTPEDLAQPPDLTPPVPHFMPDIQKDLDSPAFSCSSVACHQTAYQPVIKPNPVNMAEYAANFASILGTDQATGTPFVNTGNPAASLILTKNLLGDGVPHAGSQNIKPFADTQNPTYKKWLYWIQNGAPF